MENNRQAISSDLIRGHIDTIILHSLLGGDKFAQQISDSIEEKSEKKYSINQATLYSSLKRLENLKFVDSYWFDVSDGRRKFFRITEKGKNEVDKNLSSWAFSRQVIDKLMDTQPEISEDNSKNSSVVNYFITRQPKEPVESSERTELSSAPNVFDKESQSVPLKSDNSSDEKSYVQNNNTDNLLNADKTEKPAVGDAPVSDKTDDKEINFRNILNGLIKNSERNPIENEENKQEIDKIDVDENEKPKFNETITISDYRAKSLGNTGKIDYGDLISDADKSGYKLKISSKDSAKPFGNLYYNKLKFYSSIVFLILVTLEIAVFSLTAYKNDFKFIFAFLPFLFVLSVALFFGCKYFKNPLKTASKKYTGDKILTAAVVAFNLLLVTFALNFLVGTDFDNKLNIVSFVIAPIVSICDLIIYFVIEFMFSKIALFHVKRT